MEDSVAVVIGVGVSNLKAATASEHFPGLLNVECAEPIGEDGFEDEVIPEGEGDAIFLDEEGRFLGLSLEECEGIEGGFCPSEPDAEGGFEFSCFGTCEADMEECLAGIVEHGIDKVGWSLGTEGLSLAEGAREHHSQKRQ